MDITRTDEEIDAILELACFCDQMSVMKTTWFGPNAGRRFRACCTNRCGYHVWVDEEPLGPRALEVIKELQETALEREKKLRAKVRADIEKVKKRNHATVTGMFVLVSLMMNLAVTTMNQDPIGDDFESYYELDE